jgi:hypothetical protein
MNYVFEATVDYLFRRVTRRARPAITLITEEQMQQAWKTGGNTPSMCDWVLVSGKYCLLVDATNHWLDEKAAQGFATEEDYRTDTEDTFVNKKFLQLKSTIELLGEKGWQGCTVDEETVYVLLVIVPNAGIPATVLSDVDFKLRSHLVLGQLVQDRDLPEHPHLPRAAGVRRDSASTAPPRRSSRCSPSGANCAPIRCQCVRRPFSTLPAPIARWADTPQSFIAYEEVVVSRHHRRHRQVVDLVWSL